MFNNPPKCSGWGESPRHVLHQDDRCVAPLQLDHPLRSHHPSHLHGLYQEVDGIHCLCFTKTSFQQSWRSARKWPEGFTTVAPKVCSIQSSSLHNGTLPTMPTEKVSATKRSHYIWGKMQFWHIDITWLRRVCPNGSISTWSMTSILLFYYLSGL